MTPVERNIAVLNMDSRRKEKPLPLIESIELHEGYRGKPYLDTKKVWTFGIGFTYLTLEESRAVLKMRVAEIYGQIKNRIDHLPHNRQAVLIEMAFQLGVRGLFNFKRMWKAIGKDDCDETIKEMLDSQWAKSDSPGRANELAMRFYDNGI